MPEDEVKDETTEKPEPEVEAKPSSKQSSKKSSKKAREPAPKRENVVPGAVSASRVVVAADLPPGLRAHVLGKPKNAAAVDCLSFCRAAKLGTAGGGFMAWAKSNGHDRMTRAEWSALLDTYRKTKVS